MSEAAPSERELDGYRAGADRFLAELDEEYYLHYAGLKPELELRPIYERHADLIELDTVKRLGGVGPRARERWSSSASAARPTSAS